MKAIIFKGFFFMAKGTSKYERFLIIHIKTIIGLNKWEEYQSGNILCKRTGIKPKTNIRIAQTNNMVLEGEFCC